MPVVLQVLLSREDPFLSHGLSQTHCVRALDHSMVHILNTPPHNAQVTRTSIPLDFLFAGTAKPL